MPPTVLTERRHPGEFLLSEANGHRSRENVTVAAEQTIAAGAVIALLAQAGGVTVSTAAAAGNTGTGTLTLASPAVTGRVRDGDYRVTCIEPATGGGRFSVEDPRGVTVGTAVVGSLFDNEVRFTIADGDPDFAAGDSFTVSVDAGPSAFVAVAFDPEATDGSERPAGIAIYPATTGEGETVAIAALVRDAEVNRHIVAWPADIADADKATAVAELGAFGIRFR